MTRDGDRWRRQRGGATSDDTGGVPAAVPAVGKRTLVQTQLGGIVQLRAMMKVAAEVAEVVEAARTGVDGAAQPLPHLDAIQRSFGRYDVTSARAQVGAAAADACGEIGAHAYAIGDTVAFASPPDLFTAAHEAVHVVQQRAGVVGAGVGAENDAHEADADRIAHAVVRGDNVEPLLAAMLGHPTPAAGPPAPPAPRAAAGATRAVQKRIEDRVPGYVFEDGRWRRERGGAITAAERTRIRGLLGERARREPSLPPQFRRAYQIHLDSDGGEPLPPVVWFRERGSRFARIDEEHRQTMTAARRAGRDPNSVAVIPVGERLDDDGELRGRTLPDGRPESSTRLDLPETDQQAGHVVMGEAVRTDGDAVLHTGGLSSCTGFATRITGRDGTSREVGHVAAGDDRGAYPQLVDTLARSLPAGGGTIDAYVNTTRETRVAPDHEDARPMPPDHTVLMRELQRDLARRLGSTHRVARDGNAIVVTAGDGSVTRIQVGVDERPPSDATAELTSGERGLRIRNGGGAHDLIDHGDAARAGHDEATDRAVRIRAILERRAASGGDTERSLARLAIADLDSAPPTAAHVDAVADAAGITDADIAAERTRGGGSPPPVGAGESGPPPARVAPVDAPRTSASEPAAPPPSHPVVDTGSRADILRAELEHRATSTDDATARRARRALEMLDEAGPEPTFEQVDEAAAHARVDIYRLAPRTPMTDVEITGSGLGATSTAADGSTSAASGSLNQHGGSASVTTSATGRREDERGVGITYTEQRDADGDVVGRDAGVSVSRGPITGEISGGYTFRCDEPAEQADGSYNVAWRVELRASLGASGSGTGGGGGGSGRGRVSRTGTQVFTGGSRTDNRDRALAYQRDFEAHAVREFERAAGAELGTVAWWRAAPAGTSREVSIGGTLSPSASVSLMRTLRLGGTGEFTAAGAASVTRGDGDLVSVGQTWELSGGLTVEGGNLVGVSLGAEGRRRVSETFDVDLETGAAAFGALLRHDAPIETGAAGVTLRRRREEDSTATRLGASVAVLGGVSGTSGTGEITETTYGADGGETVTRTATGREGFEGTAVTGRYARRGFDVEAPQTDEDYRIRTELHASDGEESAAMLGDDLGAGRAGSRAASSGNWIISEGLSQDEALRFHRRLLEDYPAGGAGPGFGHPLRDAWLELRHVRTDDDALAGDPDRLLERRRRRSAAMADYLSEHGRDGLSAVRRVAGDTDESQYLRLFHDGEEDLAAVGDTPIGGAEDTRRRVATFMGETRCREMERWIAARASGPITPDDVVEARRRADDMDARIAQIADVDRYTDLPPDVRAAELRRYRGYRDGLAAIVERAGDAVGETMSADGRGALGELRALQRRVDDARARASRSRDDVVAARRHWGQMASEMMVAERLPPAIAARTDRMWSSAETAYEGAEDARRAADTRLADSLASDDTRGEHDQLAAYRSAEADLERARSFYDTADDEMRRLDRVYDRIARRDELAGEAAAADDDGGDERAPRRRPARPPRVEDAEDTAPAAVPDGDATTSSSDGPAVISIPWDPVVSRIRPDTVVAEFDRSPIAVHGGTVVIAAVRVIGAPSPETRAVIGEDGTAYAVVLEIATPLAVGRSFVIRGTTPIVVNQRGEQFVTAVARR